MAFITDSWSAGHNLSERFANLRANWAEARARRNTYTTTLAELSVLSNRDLADLGISRSQIKSISYEAAYGK